MGKLQKRAKVWFLEIHLQNKIARPIQKLQMVESFVFRDPFSAFKRHNKSFNNVQKFRF